MSTIFSSRIICRKRNGLNQNTKGANIKNGQKQAQAKPEIAANSTTDSGIILPIRSMGGINPIRNINPKKNPKQRKNMSKNIWRVCPQNPLNRAFSLLKERRIVIAEEII
jgi:hypothetical protein